MLTYPSIYLEDQLEIRRNLHGANSLFDDILWGDHVF